MFLLPNERRFQPGLFILAFWCQIAPEKQIWLKKVVKNAKKIG